VRDRPPVNLPVAACVAMPNLAVDLKYDMHLLLGNDVVFLKYQLSKL